MPTMRQSVGGRSLMDIAMDIRAMDIAMDIAL